MLSMRDLRWTVATDGRALLCRIEMFLKSWLWIGFSSIVFSFSLGFVLADPWLMPSSGRHFDESGSLGSPAAVSLPFRAAGWDSGPVSSSCGLPVGSRLPGVVDMERTLLPSHCLFGLPPGSPQNLMLHGEAVCSQSTGFQVPELSLTCTNYREVPPPQKSEPQLQGHSASSCHPPLSLWSPGLRAGAVSSSLSLWLNARICTHRLLSFPPVSPQGLQSPARAPASGSSVWSSTAFWADADSPLGFQVWGLELGCCALKWWGRHRRPAMGAPANEAINPFHLAQFLGSGS